MFSRLVEKQANPVGRGYTSANVVGRLGIFLALLGSIGCWNDARAQGLPEAPASSAPPASGPHVRNVVLITIDSLRADMPWSGYARPIAPHLTALAGRAVQYSHAYAISSYTSQSVAGLLAGRYPSELRRDGQFFNHFSRDNLFFPEVLQAASIRTLSAMAHFYFRRNFAGFDQGFDVWQLVPTQTDFQTDRDITGDAHEALAERILSTPENTSGRFFAWFHFMDPHDQYLPHPSVPPYGRGLRDLYDAEVTYTDHAIGRLLDFIAAQPWARDTGIIVSADHGEAFGEHGAFRHGFELWQPLVRIPLLFVLPGVSPRTIDANRSQLDLARTILDLMGIAAPAEIHGESLVPEINGGPAPDRDVVLDLAETLVNHPRRALIHDHYKFIMVDGGARTQLFDLTADPDELHPLRASEPAVLADLSARMRAASRALETRPAALVEDMHAHAAPH